jgi:hypothetical protein
MCRSKRITSGFKAAVIEIASAKLLASPNTLIAGSPPSVPTSRRQF